MVDHLAVPKVAKLAAQKADHLAEMMVSTKVGHSAVLTAGYLAVLMVVLKAHQWEPLHFPTWKSVQQAEVIPKIMIAIA